MMGLSNTLGLGLILSWQDRASAGIGTANRSLKQLHGTSARTAAALIKDTERIRASIDRARAGMRMGMKLAGIGVAVTAPVALAVKTAASFEDKLNDIASTMVGVGVGGEEIERTMKVVANAILDAGDKVRVPTMEIAEGTYALASSLGAATAAAVTEGTALLSVAGKAVTYSDAMKHMTKSLNTFGGQWDATMDKEQQAQRVLDQTSAIIATFDTDITRLGKGFQYAAGEAAAYGHDYAETMAGIAAATTAGLEDSMAGTSYVAMMRGALQAQKKLTTEEGKKRLGRLAGLSLYNKETGELLSQIQIVREVEKIWGITGEQVETTRREIAASGLKGEMAQTELLKRIGVGYEEAMEAMEYFSDEGKRYLFAILGRTDEIVRAVEFANNAVGVGAAMAGKRQEGLNAQLQIMKNNIVSLGDTMGRAPLPELKEIVVWSRLAVLWMNNYAKAHPKAAKWIAYGQAGVGALMAMGGSILTMIFYLKMLAGQRAMVRLLEASTGATRSVGLLTRAWRAAKIATVTLGNSLVFLRLKLAAVAMATGVAKAVAWAFSAAVWSNPITWLVVGIAAIVAELIVFVFYMDWFIEKFGYTCTRIWLWFYDIKQKISEAWTNLWNSVKETFFNIMNAIIASPVFQILIGFIDSIVGVAQSVGGWFGLGGEERATPGGMLALPGGGSVALPTIPTIPTIPVDATVTRYPAHPSPAPETPPEVGPTGPDLIRESLQVNVNVSGTIDNKTDWSRVGRIVKKEIEELDRRSNKGRG